MERIATSFCSFERLIKGYTYVDKTDLLWRLVSNQEDTMFFLARPRRFGKSLMLDTLKCIFEGRRELFKGLKIEKKRYDWKKYPVVHLDMSNEKGETPAQLIENLLGTVDSLVARFGCEGVRRYTSPGRYFGEFLRALAAKHGAFVVLIDEYDVPLQGFLGNAAAIRRVRTILHDFYVQLKMINSANVRFLMMTGVTKLTKLSVFSGLNNPADLTMDRPEYAALLGYTAKEIETYFPKRLQSLAKKLKTDRKGALKALLAWYDSYRFSPYSAVRVCNPISIAKALETGIVKNYWAKTASASLVMERMEAERKTPADFEDCEATVDELDVCDAMRLPVKALMYQGGYLTIKRMVGDANGSDGQRLILGIPNHEVRTAIRTGWFDSVVGVSALEFDSLVETARRQLASGDVLRLVGESLYRVYAKVPHEWRIRSEADAKRHFRLFMEMLGAKVAAEESSALGAADVVLETRDHVWIFEFKFDKSAASAIRQIRTKGYAAPYRGGRRAVTLVGIKFDSKRRNIVEPLIESES